MNVIVAHPSLQHAHQLALALHEAGCLQEFWSTVPLKGRGDGGFLGRLHQMRITTVPDAMRRHPASFAIVRTLARKLLLDKAANLSAHLVEYYFDRWAARRFRMSPAPVIIGYENACLELFISAKARGSHVILDAASVHYEAATCWLSETGQRDPDWVKTRKRQEIELADLILTCSQFAAETYVAAGVPQYKLRVCPLGGGQDIDAPLEQSLLSDPRREPVRFLFAGAASLVKGADLLVDVFEELHRERQPVELMLVGGITNDRLRERLLRSTCAIHKPFLPQAELFKLMRQSDCLVLPSRLDSFGMVVPEAMSCGLPCAVSSRVGAKMIVEANPGTGWIFEPNHSALRAALLQVVRERGNLPAMRRSAISAARQYTWSKYRAQVVDTIQRFLTQQHAGTQ